MIWTETKIKLPEENKYVLCRVIRPNWFDKDDQDNVNCVVLKLVRGITISERNSYPDSTERKRLYTSGDEYGNNKTPYYWKSFGPSSYFGQDVSHWTPIELPK